VATAKSKKQPTLVTINPTWQLAFIVAMVVTQVISVGTILWLFTRHGNYISSGTWAYQIVQWLYPLLFVGAAYFFVRRRVTGLMPRLFWMVFVATIGVAFWGTLQLLLNALFSAFSWWPQVTSADNSWWSAFGITWTEMFVLFALYCTGLWLIAREGKRR
jgi:hypothetical protein